MYWEMFSHHPAQFLSSLLSLDPRIYRMFIISALISFCYVVFGGLVSIPPSCPPPQELSNGSSLKPVFCVVGWDKPRRKGGSCEIVCQLESQGQGRRGW